MSLSLEPEGWILTFSASLEARGVLITQTGGDCWEACFSDKRGGHGWHYPTPFLQATAAQMLYLVLWQPSRGHEVSGKMKESPRNKDAV